jgi:hypothetical protein
MGTGSLSGAASKAAERFAFYVGAQTWERFLHKRTAGCEFQEVVIRNTGGSL